MIEIKFTYKEKKTKIKCNKVENTTDVFRKFASQAKLNYDNLLFFYNGSKVNLNVDLVLEDQFNLKEKQKKLKILVFDDISPEEFFAKFSYNTNEDIIKCSKNEKIGKIIDKFILKEKVRRDKILLLCNGEIITDNDLNKTYDQLACDADKQTKMMNIVVTDYDDRDSVNSITPKEEKPPLDINDPSELSENLIIQNSRNNRTIDLITKKYYLKLLFILNVQYGLISLLTWLGFFYNINMIFIKNDNIMKWTFFASLFVIFIASFIYIAFLKQFKKEKCLYVFNILFGLFIIINCFLLSKYIDSNNIIRTLILILIELIAMEFYALIFNCFNLCVFGLISFIFSMISIVGAYYWIKDVNTIIRIYSIGTSFFIYSLFMIFISLKLCQKDEYIFASLIYNYSIFFGLSFILITILSIFSCIENYFKNLKENYSYAYFYIRIYFFIIIQYIIIIFCIWLGFSEEYNKIFISSTSVMLWTFIPSLLINFAMCICFVVNFKKNRQSGVWYIYHILYIPYIIIYSFLLSNFIEQQIILILLFIHSVNLIAILIYLLLFRSDNLCGIFVSFFIVSIISIIFLRFYFSWIKDDKTAIYISIIAFLNIIYLIICSYVAKENCDSDEYNFAVIIFNYGIFCFVLGLILLGLFLVCGGCK